MTCIVPSYVSDDHVHFLDGAGGGYALAAQALKEKLAAQAKRRARAPDARARRDGSPSASPRSSASSKRGFFIPYRYADQVPRARRAAALRGARAALRRRRADILRAPRTHGHLCRGAAAIGARPPPEPRWNQDWFPRLDAAAAYVLVRDARPRPHRRGRLRPFDALHGRAVRDGGLRHRDHRDRPGAARRHRGRRRDAHPPHACRRPGPRRSRRSPPATSSSSIPATS